MLINELIAVVLLLSLNEYFDGIRVNYCQFTLYPIHINPKELLLCLCVISEVQIIIIFIQWSLLKCEIVLC